MSGACVECGSNDTELRRGDDGHFRKHCPGCGHVGGPYVSSQISRGDSAPGGGQASLADF